MVKLLRPLRSQRIPKINWYGFRLQLHYHLAQLQQHKQHIRYCKDEEIDAMRRYVADWSKNSVLIPFKDEDGKLSYIDFSHLNAYDTVTRPISNNIKCSQSR